HLTGWIDWNLLLNTRGGPNHARNYCLAPILVDSGKDDVFYTPLYYAMAHVSRFVRPGARRIGLEGAANGCLATAFQNPDQSIAVVVFNPGEEDQSYSLDLPGLAAEISVNLPAQGLQTVFLEVSPSAAMD
ncbi:MAG TPA: glycoside hydrolase family 30 beta sandwich domain-containing protein, partial [Oceanipulchritudo sp.]|nr:glycoside hydrolase family 30 beta sandwich domain-containing protein [Oceanipulchritudo sp.]